MLRGHESRPHCHDTVLQYAVMSQVPTLSHILLNVINFFFRASTFHIFPSVLVSDFISYSSLHMSQSYHIHLLISAQDSAHCSRCQNRHPTELTFFDLSNFQIFIIMNTSVIFHPNMTLSVYIHIRICT
jgi:hypothetical protein